MRRKQRKRREGYLLLTVVVMIAVASLMLARMSSVSLRLANTAIEEERELRNRWAATSLRRFTLDGAGRMLQSQSFSDGEDSSGAVLWKEVQLAEQRWRIIVSDESAKVNVLQATREFERAKLRQLINESIPSSTQLRALDDREVTGAQPRLRWEHWLGHPNGLSPSPRAIATASQRLTLWGDGQLNVCQCDEQTIDALWRQLFGHTAPRQLHVLRQQSPPPAPHLLISALGLRESQVATASRWVTTESTCFSVWVFCQSDRRVPASLYVEWGQQRATEHRGYEY